MDDSTWRMLRWVDGPNGDRLAAEILPWDGTRYAKGQSVRSVAANCVGFFVRVYEGLYGLDRWRIPTVADDAAFHSPPTARRALRALIEHFRPFIIGRSVVSPGGEPVNVSPGDVIVSGPHRGGPGHVLIVGWRRNTMWHAASPSGVHMTGMTIPQHAVYRVYRTRKEWVDVPR